MGLGTDSQHDSRAPPAAAAACSPRPRSQLSILSPTESVKTDGQIFRNPKRGAWTQHSTVSALCMLFVDNFWTSTVCQKTLFSIYLL